MDGLELLRQIDGCSVDACFADFQYRGILDRMSYGNEGEKKQVARSQLQQMTEGTILNFLLGITRVLKPSSYMFMWVDKFIIAEASHLKWFECVNENWKPYSKTTMNLVDLLVWDKKNFGNGYRTRRTNEFMLIFQKSPKTTKNWIDRSIRDTWEEKIPNPRNKDLHPHRKPIELTTRLIKSVTDDGDLIGDFCAGSFSTFDACKLSGRQFIGCDIERSFCDD
jgi:site-specific DNA-methyltransferase (adenine-specific)